MQVFIERTQQRQELEFSGVAKDLLQELHIGTEEVLIIRNGTLVTEDETLETTDEIRLLSVISGG